MKRQWHIQRLGVSPTFKVFLFVAIVYTASGRPFECKSYGSMTGDQIHFDEGLCSPNGEWSFWLYGNQCRISICGPSYLGDLECGRLVKFSNFKGSGWDTLHACPSQEGYDRYAKILSNGDLGIYSDRYNDGNFMELWRLSTDPDFGGAFNEVGEGASKLTIDDSGTIEITVNEQLVWNYTPQPTVQPTVQPTNSPVTTVQPTVQPTNSPVTANPSSIITPEPTMPSLIVSVVTPEPTMPPSAIIANQVVMIPEPTLSPSFPSTANPAVRTPEPTISLTFPPTANPTVRTPEPTMSPSFLPTANPTTRPSRKLTDVPQVTTSPASASPPSILSAIDKLSEVNLPGKDNIFKYLDFFDEPVLDPSYNDSLGFSKHTWDPLGAPSTKTRPTIDGPSCILGTRFSAYSRTAQQKESGISNDKSKNLLIFLQGGGACWEGFTSTCYVDVLQTEPLTLLNEYGASGIFDLENEKNPFKDYNLIYAPYCDGSVWLGDNLVPDTSYYPTLDEQVPGVNGGFRNHRGLRNLSVTIELAKKMFPNVERITLMGHSAGGAGSTFGTFLVRKVFGNGVDLTSFNDAGPIANNPEKKVSIAARENDWDYCKFLPTSVADCQLILFVDWILKNDFTVRMAFYCAAADAILAAYLEIPVLANNAPLYLSGNKDFLNYLQLNYDSLSVKYPGRFSSFIVASFEFIFDSTVKQDVPLLISHGLVQKPEFYRELTDTFSGNQISLSDWTSEFLVEQSSNVFVS
eukprot:CAMPEP_0194271244 /NCGR_PEP_ID=MMETSP0169-20130528/5083_1 /TAXON_ID=218684 /ORGANISM="Corethron pennatum, Strain L29A3" /LENGTH=745 /DNA_ID=CAMNT_0039013553 /DNA_START=88 /DNA_END=2325 /DNA_ORIENTATION=+